MGGYDSKMVPREGQLYAEYLLKDILRTHPENAGSPLLDSFEGKLLPRTSP
jgi:hypothetical protein